MFHWQYMKCSSVVPKMDEFEGLKDKINELSLQSPEFWKTKVIQVHVTQQGRGMYCQNAFSSVNDETVYAELTLPQSPLALLFVVVVTEPLGISLKNRF